MKVSASKLREAEFYFTEGEKYFVLEDYAKALVLFQKSLEINESSAASYYKIAQIHSLNNDLEKALENSLKALELDQDNKYFYVLAADIYTRMADFTHAAEIYENFIGRLKNTDQYLFELAAIYLYQNKLEEALLTYDKIENSYGISEEVTYQKQKILLRNNDLEKALAEGEKLIKAYPEEEIYVIKQVEILISNDQISPATIYLERFLSEHPQSSQSRLVLAELRRKQGDLEGAKENLQYAFRNPELDVKNKVQLLAEYREELSPEEIESFGIELAQILVETHPEVADAHTVYADLLFSSKKSEKAKDQYIKALQLDESNFNVWQNVLQIYIDLNKIDSVIIMSEEALELFPNQGSIYYYNGAANLQKQNYNEAIHSLEQGKRLSSSNLGLINAFNSMLGDAYNGVKNYKKSNEAYEAALDFDPENYVVLNNYSYYLALRKENLEKAEKMAAKVVKNNPLVGTYIDTYAWVLYMRGKYKEAKKVMEQAFKANDISAVHYEHYGDILFQLGDVDEAVKQWQIAKGMNPNSELIDKKIAERKLHE